MPKSEEAKDGSVNQKTVKASNNIKSAKPISKSNETSQNTIQDKVNSYREKALEIENNIVEKINANPSILSKKYRHLISVNKLMETGAHIGLNSRKWNPKMKPYIFIKKGSNHIINLSETVIALNNAYNFLIDVTKANMGSQENSPILIVGTRGKIIKTHVKEQAKRAKCFYINERWLGGTLTNFKTITNSINKFNNLLLMFKNHDIEKYTKKEQISIKKDTERYAKFFSGIRTMKEIPKVLVLTDPEKEEIAIKEAKKLEIPVIAICNTNAKPENVDYVIPANNSSIKTVYLIVGLLCDAIAEAKGIPKQFAEKKDEEILLPEVIKKKPEFKKHYFNQNQK